MEWGAEGSSPKGVATAGGVSQRLCAHSWSPVQERCSQSPWTNGPAGPDDAVAESGILSLPNHRILKDGGRGRFSCLVALYR